MTTTNTDAHAGGAEERRKLRALEREATPGPWARWVDHLSIYAGEITNNTPGRMSGRPALFLGEFDGDDIASDLEAERNADLAVEARNALRGLLDAADERDVLAAEVVRLREALSGSCAGCTGKGTTIPECYLCRDSGNDHVCDDDPRTCWSCKGDGLSAKARAALALAPPAPPTTETPR